MANRIMEILQNYTIADWEETSIVYCKLMLLKRMGGGKAIVICTDKQSWEASACERYLSQMNIYVERFVEVAEFENLLNDILNFMDCDRNVVIATCPVKKSEGKTGIVCKIKSIIDRHITEKNKYIEFKKISENLLDIKFPYWRTRREEIYLYAKENTVLLEKLAEKLADNESREVLYEIIRCSTENDIYRRAEGRQEDKYWECYRHVKDEILVNCGSAVGDTILKYLEKGYDYEKIYAFEGNEGSYTGLESIISMLPKCEQEKIVLYNEFIGINQDAGCFDDRFADKRVTLINMDIEGAEMGVLRGARGIIQRERPVLAVCTYHKTTDLLDIPKLIDEVVPDYKLYLRKYRGYEPNALNEYLYYAVPNERALE